MAQIRNGGLSNCQKRRSTNDVDVESILLTASKPKQLKICNKFLFSVLGKMKNLFTTILSFFNIKILQPLSYKKRDVFKL